jgi:hypothetical protein
MVVAGVMDTLQGLVLEAYDRIIGLELSDVAVDGCITKAREVAANKRAKARWIEEKGHRAFDGGGIPPRGSHRPGQSPRPNP